MEYLSLNKTKDLRDIHKREVVQVILCSLLALAVFVSLKTLHIQNRSGAHPASYPMGTGSSFPGE
jgi:hypothetical protein